MSDSFFLQEVPGKTSLNKVSHLAVVLLCTLHSTSKKSVWAVCYMIGNSKEFVPNRVKNQDKAGARCNIGPLRKEVVLQEIRIKINKLSTEVVKCQRWDETARCNSAVRLLCKSARPFLSAWKKGSIVIRSRPHPCDASGKTMSKNEETKAS